ncbi:hypothetical protein EDB92DRAFT_401398 [Lactarius akahatsu]|uniref:HIT-type domain-containing protein n=1 Tax=Lactarius akahatsu TaxID=416441 RepID=A0AAD4Q8Z7_9AGAM|nr:hypothetical protein EDB92DRAFT_401398 [Lactarius akahatsu]
MSPKTRAQCRICNEKESKYTCSSCLVEYCSVGCYKRHKETSCSPSSSNGMEPGSTTPELGGHSRPHLPHDDEIRREIPLRPLTSLKWPYVPEESTYPDPLKRDDPKPLQTKQYESIATSPAVRAALEGHPGLKELLRTIDRLRGPAREEALQAGLGVSRSQVNGRDAENAEQMRIGEEERRAMRELAEAIEMAVRGNESILGLDWGDLDGE